MRAGWFSFYRFVLVFLAISLGIACAWVSFGADVNETVTPVSASATEVIILPESTHTSPSPSSTLPPVPTSTLSPTIPPQSVNLTDTSPTSEPKDYFIEEFDHTLDNWELIFMHGDENQAEVFTEDDRLTFYLDGEEIYAYVMYTSYPYNDVMLTAVVENRGYSNNNVSLICRYDQDVGWYEFNIASNGLYWMLYFDAQENVYKFLADGGSTRINTGEAVNEYSAVCEGNSLILYINGVETRRFVDRQYLLEEGLVGVSVSSFKVHPVEVDFISLEISSPQNTPAK